MPVWTDFLRRFRPAGAPGAAGPRGVPANRQADAAVELMPLWPLVDDIHTEVDRIRLRADEQAELLRRDGADDAAAIVEAARGREDSITSDAAARLRGRAAAEQTELRVAHMRAVRELRARTDERMARYVDRVVRQARNTIIRATDS